MHSTPLSASSPVDQFELPWQSFSDFFYQPDSPDANYLTELGSDITERNSWTREQWKNKVTEATGFLRSLNVAQGDVVATLAGNSATALSIAFACWSIGATVMPLNPAETDERLRFLLRDSNTTLLVHTSHFSELVNNITDDVSITTHNATYRGFAHDPIYDDQLSSDLGVDTDALLVYTSGTTGDPKPVRLTMRNILTHTDGLTQASGWQSEDRVITVLPIHHVNGLLISCLLPWNIGASTVLCDRFRSERFWSDVRREAATVTSVVPSILEFLMNTPEQHQGLLTEVFCGAGPLRPDAAVGFEQQFGIPIRHLYGLSEVSAVACIMPRMTAEARHDLYTKYGFPSIGSSMPHVEVEVLNSDFLPCSSGTKGQLGIRGATVFAGYQKPHVEEPFANGWFLTGDQGFWEMREGTKYFFITGRTKELIIRGGVNLAPVEIDAALMSHDAVTFGVAIPFENRYYGEEVAAYVVAHDQVSAEELIEHCQQHIGFEKSPKVIVFGDEVPFTSTGKARRLELKDRLAPELQKYHDTQFRR